MGSAAIPTDRVVSLSPNCAAAGRVPRSRTAKWATLDSRRSQTRPFRGPGHRYGFSPVSRSQAARAANSPPATSERDHSTR